MALKLIKKFKRSFAKNVFIQKLAYLLFHQFYNDMDAVLEITNSTAENVLHNSSAPMRFKMNLRYLAPVTLCFLFFVDTLLNLASVGWNVNHIPGDGTMAQKIMPPSLAHQADIFWLDVITITGGIAGLALFHEMAPFDIKTRMLTILCRNGTLKGIKQNGQGGTV